MRYLKWKNDRGRHRGEPSSRGEKDFSFFSSSSSSADAEENWVSWPFQLTPHESSSSRLGLSFRLTVKTLLLRKTRRRRLHEMQILFPRKQLNQFVARECRESFSVVDSSGRNSEESEGDQSSDCRRKEKSVSLIRQRRRSWSFAQVERNIN